MVIAKTASRNVAFKAGKMIESVFYTQANFVTPEVRGHDGLSGHDECYIHTYLLCIHYDMLLIYGTLIHFIKQ